MEDPLKDIKLEKLKLLEEKAKLVRGLPHMYGFKDYKWSREFLDSNEKTLLLTAANQLGKSTSQIRKIVDFATNIQAWPSRFRRQPRQFWYLYPTSQIATAEFHTKWKPDILPKDDFRDDPQYGWKAEFKNRGDISAIYFNSGVALYFKTYAQDAQHLQSGTVDYVACFTGDQLVTTRTGLKRIDSVLVGDEVWTKENEWKPVNKVFNREAPRTIKRMLSNGEVIHATPEHKFWVKEKWVEFEQLTPSEILGSQNEWLKKKQKFLKEENILVTPKVKIEDITTFKYSMNVKVRDFFIGRFGSFIGGQYRKVVSSIIWMKMLQTIRLVTWPVSRRVNTLVSINCTNTEQGCWGFLGKEIVLAAKGFFTLKLLRLLQQIFAPKNVGEFITEQKNCVLLAAQNLFKRQTVGETELFVLTGVLESPEKLVYCLNVNDYHNFQVCGIIAKNCDEELPLELWDEINFRRNAVDGYFSMVFTATLGQEFWRLAMEPKMGEQETMPFAKKLRASLFDCQHFLDGTASHWTLDKIHRTIAMCKSEAEVQRRVYGRFVKDEGLKYPSFERGKNIIPPNEPPAHWPVYVGVDIGAGGDENHPSAITFVAVRPDYKYAIVFRHWRGDDKVYTMSDVAYKYMELSQDVTVTAAFYDYHAKDFKTITDRMGLSFIPAEKKHDVGEQIINVLFKNRMLDIFNTQECAPIVNELTTLQLGTDKRKAKDDSVDSMRYALTKIPFDFSHVGYAPVRDVQMNRKKLDPFEVAYAERNKDRLRMLASGNNSGLDGIQDDIKDWNEVIGVDLSDYEDFF